MIIAFITRTSNGTQRARIKVPSKRFAGFGRSGYDDRVGRNRRAVGNRRNLLGRDLVGNQQFEPMAVRARKLDAQFGGGIAVVEERRRAVLPNDERTGAGGGHDRAAPGTTDRAQVRYRQERHLCPHFGLRVRGVRSIDFTRVAAFDDAALDLHRR